jgi:hypothetical protein
MEAAKYFASVNNVPSWADSSAKAANYASRIDYPCSVKYVQAVTELAYALSAGGDGQQALKCLDLAESTLPKAHRRVG